MLLFNLKRNFNIKVLHKNKQNVRKTGASLCVFFCVHKFLWYDNTLLRKCVNTKQLYLLLAKLILLIIQKMCWFCYLFPSREQEVNIQYNIFLVFHIGTVLFVYLFLYSVFLLKRPGLINRKPLEIQQKKRRHTSTVIWTGTLFYRLNSENIIKNNFAEFIQR